MAYVVTEGAEYREATPRKTPESQGRSRGLNPNKLSSAERYARILEQNQSRRTFALVSVLQVTFLTSGGAVSGQNCGTFRHVAAREGKAKTVWRTRVDSNHRHSLFGQKPDFTRKLAHHHSNFAQTGESGRMISPKLRGPRISHQFVRILWIWRARLWLLHSPWTSDGTVHAPRIGLCGRGSDDAYDERE